MALNQNELNALLGLDDRRFASLIMSIVSAAGGSEEKAQKLVSDIPALKKLLSRLTPDEAENLLFKAGKEKSEDIYRIINNEREKHGR